jgi:hypothetical protein
VSAATRADAHRIIRAHGNITGWTNAMWRAQEAAEVADALAAQRAEAERERWTPLFPSDNADAWACEPVPALRLDGGDHGGPIGWLV